MDNVEYIFYVAFVFNRDKFLYIRVAQFLFETNYQIMEDTESIAHDDESIGSDFHENSCRVNNSYLIFLPFFFVLFYNLVTNRISKIKTIIT
jgi:hypothetical protein